MSAGLPGAAIMLKTIGGLMVRAAVPFDPNPPFADGDAVVVHLDGSPVIGHVVARCLLVMAKQPMTDGLPEVVRRATAQDLTMRQRHEQRERDAFRLGVMKIRERGLAMKLARVEQAFDGSKLVFFFTAEERVDFRELVRELASDFKTRIELRQIGVRDEARMLAGYGTCGRSLCCSTWLHAFDPVSIKMAKLQDLALNPSRLSGLCGRLKCCLRYELIDGALPPVARGDESLAESVKEPGSRDRGGACGHGRRR
ncbi:MAG: regulatory iron-sulfur-containing complex subunit RicT [Acidobacteria bacterium]|nr:regulatory iron-sulfur-containing complex subunit RicT [Acidobacteriota bacterium]